MRAGTFTSRLRPRPAVGSNGSPSAPADPRSAASSSGSTTSKRPLRAAIRACPSNSRGRDRTISSGSADSHP